MKAAVTDDARRLKASHTPESTAIVKVRSAIGDCAGVVGAEEAIQPPIAESERWTRDAFHAAQPTSQ